MPVVKYRPNYQQQIEWEIFRAKMVERRHALGLRLQDVAERMGRTKTFVSHLEKTGIGLPNVLSVLLWIEALEGSFSYDSIEWFDNTVAELKLEIDQLKGKA